MIIIKICVIMYFLFSHTIYFDKQESDLVQSNLIKKNLNDQLRDSEKLLDQDREKSYEIALRVLEIADSLKFLSEQGKALFLIGRNKAMEYQNSLAIDYFRKANRLFKAINDTLLAVDTQYYIVTKYIEMGNYFGIIEQLDSLLNFYIANNYFHRAISTKRAQGLFYYYNNNFEKSIQFYLEGLNFAHNNSIDENDADLNCLLGCSYAALCEYDRSLEYAFKSLKINKDQNDYHSLIITYQLIAAVYADLNNYSRSLDFSIKSLSLHKHITDKFLIASSYNSIGMNYFNLAVYDSALFYFREGLEIEKEISYQQGIALSYNYIGNVYYITGDLNKAKVYYKNAFLLIQNVGDLWGIAKISVNLGNLYTRLEDYKQAKYHLTKGLNAANQVKAKDIILDSYDSLSEYYKNLNNFRKSHFYLEKYIQLKDSTIIENTHRISEMQLRYESDKREKENQVLENKIAIQNLQLQKSTLLSWLLFLGLILVIVIIVFISILYKSKIKLNERLKQKIDTILENYKKQQQIIVHQASLTSLGEMSASISHEINQALQDIIFSIESLKAGFKDDHKFKKGVNEINADIDRIYNTINHVRCFSSMQKDDSVEGPFNINDSIMDAFNLTRRQLSKNNIDVFFNFKTDLNPYVGNRYKFEQVILNILSNSKDAIVQKNELNLLDYKGVITIETKEDKNCFLVQLQDNGIGIPEEQKNEIFKPFYTTKKIGDGTGLGLSIAKNIISDMGGILSFQSSYMCKTIFTIELPVKVL